LEKALGHDVDGVPRLIEHVPAWISVLTLGDEKDPDPPVLSSWQQFHRSFGQWYTNSALRDSLTAFATLKSYPADSAGYPPEAEAEMEVTSMTLKGRLFARSGVYPDGPQSGPVLKIWSHGSYASACALGKILDVMYDARTEWRHHGFVCPHGVIWAV